MKSTHDMEESLIHKTSENTLKVKIGMMGV